jgi:hypothetical protein
MNHFEDSVKHRTPQRDQQYVEAKAKYYDEEPHIDSWFDRHDKLQAKDPEAYAARGSKPSDPVHAPIKKPEAVSAPAAPATEQSTPVQQPAEAKKPDLKSVDMSGIDLSTIPADILKKLGIEPPKGGK